KSYNKDSSLLRNIACSSIQLPLGDSHEETGSVVRGHLDDGICCSRSGSRIGRTFHTRPESGTASTGSFGESRPSWSRCVQQRRHWLFRKAFADDILWVDEDGQ